MQRVFLILAFFVFDSVICTAQNLTPLGTGLRVNGAVYCIETDSLTGRTFIGGYFNQVDNVPAKNIAWHDASGWHAFGSGADGYVITLEYAYGRLFAGGGFTHMDGVAANHVAQWSGAVWNAMGSGIPGAYLRSMKWYNSSLYVSGYFANAGGQQAANIAFWDGSNWHNVGSGSNNYYVYLSILNDTLYAYGGFTKFNGDPTCIEKFDGTNWQPLSSDTSNYIHSIAMNRDTLFAVVYNQSTYYDAKIVFYDSGVWTDYLLHTGRYDNQFLFSYHDTLYFTNSGTTDDSLLVNAIANTAQVHISAFSKQGANTYYQCLSAAILDDNAFICGFFNNVNGSLATGLIKYDGFSWTSPAYMSVCYYDSWYYGYGRYLLYDSTLNMLLVSGKFNFAGGVASPNIAAWDGTQWHAMGNGLFGGDDGYAGRMLYFNDTLYVCGNFYFSGSTPVRGLAKWDGATWLPVGGPFNGLVKSAAVYMDTLYVVGEFDSIGSLAAKHIAKYDGTNWHIVTGVNGTSTNSFMSLIQGHGKLYLGGNSFYVGTNSNRSFAIYDSGQWITVTAPTGIRLLEMLNDTLYATSGSSSGIYHFNGAAWNLTSYPYTSGLYSYPSMINNQMVVGNWDDNVTYIHAGNSWPELMHYDVLDCLDKDSSLAWITGFIPDNYPGQNEMGNIALLNKIGPIASFTQNRDSICDHQYISFSGPSSGIWENYEWNIDGGTPGYFNVQNPVVNYHNAGDFFVYLKVSTVFGSDSILVLNAVHVDDCTATLVSKTGISGINIFPNPFNDQFQIETGGKHISIILSDISGKILIKKRLEGSEQVSSDFLEPGIYLLTVITETGNASFKIVKM